MLALLASVGPVRAAGAEPDRADVDWPTGRLHALGVGTPRLLSPTGSLLLEDATELARSHARRRLAEALLALPVPPGAAEAARRAAANRAPGLVRFDEPRFFSDGTVHLPAQLDVFAALGHGVPAPEPEVTVTAPAAFRPCLLLLLRGPTGVESPAGQPGDPTPWIRYGTGPVEGAPAASPAPCVLSIAGPTPKALRVVLPSSMQPPRSPEAP
ncbi:hypothetical protein L6V77_09750 [Myxococcota bacterium]|nr:hypothetical protein [Myxococcota bacterium]